MSTGPVRRSQRGKSLTYKIGDLVEIVLSGGVSTGRLVRRVDVSKNLSPRWVVAFENEEINDQELCEKSFGKLVDNEASIMSQRKKGRYKSSKNGALNIVGTLNDNLIEKNRQDIKCSKKMSPEIASISTKKASSRNSPVMKKPVNTRSSRKKRKSPLKANETLKKKKGRKSKEECTRVPFLTGTLLLYRGENPRAVFLRKF